MSWVELKVLLRGTLRELGVPLRLAVEVVFDPKFCVKNRSIIFLVVQFFKRFRFPPSTSVTSVVSTAFEVGLNPNLARKIYPSFFSWFRF
jgi:hypothetical protein